MTKLDKKILNELFSSSAGLEPFTLFQRIKVNISVLSDSLNRLSALGYANSDGDQWSITDAGIRKSLETFRSKKIETGRQVPEEMRREEKFDVYYIPKRSLLDTRTFNVDLNNLD